MEFEKLFKLLSLIPEGKVVTYKLLAEQLNTHPRAVGKMLNANPFPIIYPCHRVVKSNGEVGGYNLGKEKKIELLESEGIKIKNKLIQNFEKRIFNFKNLI